MKNDRFIKYLNKYFHLENFRDGQLEVIESIYNKKNTLVVMPTGGGKSLCFQLPALLLKGVAIVISPLISLMKDQVDTLRELNLPAVTINSTINEELMNNIYNDISQNKYKIIYVSPERLSSSRFIEVISQIEISFIAVDEAHCISEWGHDFRPAYLNIRSFINQLNKTLAIIALTATATPEVQNDIIEQLNMQDTNMFIRGFIRPNIKYHIEFILNSEKSKRIYKIISKSKGSNIIYCGSRKKVEQVYKDLTKLGLKCIHYHAGMDDEYRKQAQEEFFNTPNSTIIATNAFGMGVDKPNVRNVIHTDITQSLEAYYQEAGRAGRDDKVADCYLLYHPLDKKLQEYFIDNTYPKLNTLKLIYNYLSINAEKNGIYTFDESIIAKELNIPVMTVLSVLKQFEQIGLIELNYSLGNSQISLYYSIENLSLNKNKILTEFQYEIIQNLVRYVGQSIFEKSCEFDIGAFSKKYYYKAEDVYGELIALVFKEILTYQGSQNILKYKITNNFIEINEIEVLGKELDLRRKIAIDKLNKVQEYIFTDECKRNFILKYFGENDIKSTCKKCSSCLGEHKIINYANISSLIKVIDKYNNKFAKSVIIDFLKGEKSKTIRLFEYYKDEMFGIFHEFSNSEIEHILNITYHLGLMQYDEKKYHCIKTTKDGLKIIKNNL